MSASSEYLDLCRKAKDALFDLLMRTEPDLAAAERAAYASLKKYIASHDGADNTEGATEDESSRWISLTIPQREAHVVEHLGEQWLTIKELTATLSRALNPDYQLWEDEVRSVVNRMFRNGKLAREGEEWRSRIRYRYYVPRELEGPIADLQRQFDSQATDNSGGAR